MMVKENYGFHVTVIWWWIYPAQIDHNNNNKSMGFFRVTLWKINGTIAKNIHFKLNMQYA